MAHLTENDVTGSSRLALAGDPKPLGLVDSETSSMRDEYEAAATLSDSATYGTYVRAHVTKLLGSVGVDVTYHRATGDHVYYRDESGEEVEVLDLLGGYGASLLGHNHPRLVAKLSEALQHQRPFNAQASIRARAGQLARRLSELVGARTGRRYVVTFGNSGAEAVEAALKHAELEAMAKRDKLREEQAATNQQVVAAFRSGELQSMLIGGERRALRTEEELGFVLREHELAFEAALRGEPQVWAIQRGFHGKTTGALKLTYNQAFRKPWSRFGAAVFLRAGDLNDIERESRRSLVSVPRLVVINGVLTEERSALSQVIACFIEPVQGEGGIHEIDREYARVLRNTANELGFPIVMDEIQSGLGRTGELLASEKLGIRADYYLFAKALGGGLTKVSALMIDSERYSSGFDYQHTSTFAEDDLSSTVALEVLELIEADNEQIIKDCRRKGAYFRERLEQLRRAYPEQIAAVRGRGLMLGLEMRPQLTSKSALIRVLSEQNLLVAFIAGHLLREHRIRVAPALSSENTIRLEPSAEIEVEEIDAFCNAVEQVSKMLFESDSWGLARFMGPSAAVAAPAVKPEAEPRKLSSMVARAPHERAAFLLHYLEPGDLRAFDQGLAGFDEQTCRDFLNRTAGIIEPFIGGTSIVRSPTGASVELSLIAVPFTSEQVMGAMRVGDSRWAVDMVRSGVRLAARGGCSVVGLGGYTSIVTDNCRLVQGPVASLTSGNSLTVAAAVDAAVARARDLGFDRPVLGVVGATGNIGMMLTEEFTRLFPCKRVILVGRQGAARRLERISQRLDVPTTVATQLSALRECNVILTASNAPFPIVQLEHIGPGPVVICDVAAPRDVSSEVTQARKDVHVLRGGLLRLPDGQSLDVEGMPLERGLVYACMAETLLLGLSATKQHFSFGLLEKSKVQRIREIAQQHGFTVEAKQDS